MMIYDPVEDFCRTSLPAPSPGGGTGGGFRIGPDSSAALHLALLKGASIVGVFWGEFAKRAGAQGQHPAMMAELAQWYGQRQDQCP